jgi:hypothetical protein
MRKCIHRCLLSTSKIDSLYFFYYLSPELEKYRPGIRDAMIKPVVLSGVRYAPTCRGMTSEVKTSYQEMDYWFRKRMGKTIQGNLRELYISRKKDVVVGKMQFNQECIYVFILNTEDKATSVQKKLINSGSDQFVRQVLPEPLRVPARAYRHVHRTVQKVRGTQSYKSWNLKTNSWVDEEAWDYTLKLLEDVQDIQLKKHPELFFKKLNFS